VRLAALGIERASAIAAVTAAPARLLGAGTFGRLERGGAANVLVLDQQLELQRVIAWGRELERSRP
jgi:N-acetylglucosamine-6-phosphate deacetylase